MQPLFVSLLLLVVAMEISLHGTSAACDEPTLPNGSVSYSGTGMFVVHTYSCNAGFTLDGKPFRLCSMGAFSTTDLQPQCVAPVSVNSKPLPVQCPQPQYGVRSTVSVTSFDVGSEAHYACVANYVRSSGDFSRTCLSSANWSGKPLHCVETCTCMLRGDPVYNRFDPYFCVLPVTSKKQVYSMASFKKSSSDPCRFSVEVGTSHPVVQGKTLRGADEPKYINIQFGVDMLRMDQNDYFAVNGQQRALPYTHAGSKFTVSKVNNFVVVSSRTCGTQISFAGKGLASIVKVKIPKSFGTETKGLCGNCDGNANDMTSADGTDISGKSNKCEILGNSYIVADSYAGAGYV